MSWLTALQCRRDETAASVAFIGAFILLQFFTIPWDTVMMALGAAGS